ncbi:MAG: signal peptidase I [Lachnospiraceae bacterium]|nr:signal peptidase I [Lachnospiraceae bacterium]
MKKGKNNGFLKKLIDLSVFILIVMVATYLCATFVTQRTRVDGISMEPTLKDGDNIMMDKLSYHFRSPKRREIICFVPENEKDIVIKRVIGLPGDTVKIENGDILINGEIYNDHIGGMNYAGLAASEIVLSDDEYFVLGDNRLDSIDSRYEEIGNVSKKRILGRAFLLFYPLERLRIVK